VKSTLICIILALLPMAPASAQVSQWTTNNKQLILQDVPAIPLTLVDRLSQYQNVRSASFLDWTGNSKGIYIRTRFGDISQVHKVSAPGGAREQITWFREPVGQVLRRDGGYELALTMDQGDAIPVTTAVSLAGCAASERSKGKVHYEGDLAVIEDDALLGGGSFGYRVLNQLDNGIYGLVVRRVLPDGSERVSLAAVDLVARPMVRHGSIAKLMMIELIGEIWIPDMQLLSFQSIGNKVHFASGVGRERVERTVDFTRIGKMRE